jgi:DNA polymerase-3 subunit delta
MIIYLHGSDTQRSATTLSEMKEKFIRERDPQRLNITQLSVGDVLDTTILEQLQVSPFLADKRMVILTKLISLGSKELHTTLLAYIEDGKLPDDTILIIHDEHPKPRASVSKKLQELLINQPYSKVFDVLTGSALTKWIVAEVSTRGGTIDRFAADALSVSGMSMVQLSHTLNQLVAYAAGNTILETDVQLFATREIDDNIFTLIDTIIDGHADQAFVRIRDQYRSGKDAQYVYAMILRQYKIMIDVADVLVRGQVPDAQLLAVHPFVLKKTVSLVKKLSFEEIKKTYIALLYMDKDIKTGMGDPRIFIDQFVGSLSRL